MQYYNQYFAIEYPFSKLDIVAVPDFSAGAMENTAAIFYRETRSARRDAHGVGRPHARTSLSFSPTRWRISGSAIW